MKRILAIACVLMGAAFAGCGGGGGGGGGEDNTVKYTGKTAQAVLTQQNAAVAAEGVHLGVPTALDLTGTQGLLRVGARPASPAPPIWELSLRMESSVEALLNKSGRRAVGREAARETGSEPGPCGGTLKYSLDLDEATGAFSGSLTYSSYCDEGVTMHGGMSVTGLMDVDTGDPIRMKFSMKRLDVKDPDPVEGSDVSMTGTIDVDVVGSEIALALTLRDNPAKEVVKFEDFRIGFTEDADGTAFTVSGRYYDPTNGYVDFRTDSPMVLVWDENGPSEGVVTASGANGTACRLTALTPDTYELAVDVNGDGDYEDAGVDYNTGALSWNDLK